MRKANWTRYLIIFAGLVILGGLSYRIPAIHNRLDWRIDFALAYARGLIQPAGRVPTALPPPAMGVTPMPTASPTKGAAATPSASPTPGPTSTPTTTPTPLPASVKLEAPEWEKQDINNCGPASLSMYLRYYGWEGDQFDIAELLKPVREDRNVNVEELVYYVRTRAGWLHAEFRVGGELETLKKLIAAGIPVIVEESFYFEETYWPNDDQWAAHYNLLTGYDDESQTFTSQDSFYGPNRSTTYERLEEYWHVFNNVYIMVYPPEMENTVKEILGPNWDVEYNRQQALEAARADTEANPEDAYAWFNLGTNLVYFERYAEAAGAFDEARRIGFPQRMLRYQFTPFFAYFHNRRTEDLLTLTEYALRITPRSEEALLWHGWGLYRQGNTAGAIQDFQAALRENPNYQDAFYALNFVNENP